MPLMPGLELIQRSLRAVGERTGVGAPERPT